MQSLSPDIAICDGREYVPAIDDKLPTVIVTVNQIFYGLSMLPKFVNTGIDATNCFAGRIVLANWETLSALHRKSRELLLKNLTRDARHGLI